MIQTTTLALLLAVAPPGPQQGGTLFDLRTRVETAMADGLSVQELETLANAGLRLAEDSGSRRGMWNALGVVAQLCSSGPPNEARALRVRALDLLARRESDTQGWSSLVTRSFLPAFGRIPREEWARELDAYERTLDDLAAAAESDRVRAELLYAKAFGRVFINRRWEWLSAAQRHETLEILAEVERHFGALPVPGAGEPQVDTVGRRARQHEYELTRLYFRAPAPPTSGVDLEDVALDLASLRGKVVVLDFWTSFCQPCLAMVPGVRRLLDDFVDEPVVYIGVCGDVDRRAGLSTAQRIGMPWRNLWDGPLGTAGPAARAWNVEALGWPSVFVLDVEGRIRFKLRGKQQVEAELERALRTLLAEGGDQE